MNDYGAPTATRPGGEAGAIAVLSWTWAAVAVQGPPASPLPPIRTTDHRSFAACAS